MNEFRRIGTIGLIALVALRVGIGWHFFKEGSDKIRSGTFSSEGFLKSSEGRLAGLFQGLVWDNDGRIRLDPERMKSFFKSSGQQAKGQFALSTEQNSEVDQLTAKFVGKLDEIYDDFSEHILKYNKGLPRVETMESDSLWSQVKGLDDQRRKIEKERIQEVMPAVQSIEAITKQFERELNGIAAKGQSDKDGQQRSIRYFYLSRPGATAFSASTLDRIIPVFDVTIGGLLILGLFVPLAGWLGAMFLAGVILSQFPGDPNTQATYFQAVEALALIVLATLGAGRFAGLDYLTWAFRQNKKATKKA